MVLQKRKRSFDDDVELVDSSDAESGNDVDISSVLTGKKSKKSKHRAPEVSEELEGADDASTDDEGLGELIKGSISKRNIKGGTELLKKTKGKAKIAKGEVGGGSFQSMGEQCDTSNTLLIDLRG